MRRAVSALALVLLVSACDNPSDMPGSPQVGSQTNWLLACDTSGECGGLQCICGTCSAVCDDDTACAQLPDAACVGGREAGAAALCSGQTPPVGICLPRCEEACPEGTSCVAGVCEPSSDGMVTVTVDTAERHQTLVGFGASLAYAEDAIVAHPQKEVFFDLVFAESGFDVLRLRNRHDSGDEAEVLAPAEIIEAASMRLGRTPLLFMTSGTPPAELKANGARQCAGDLETCTLVSLPGVGFDYGGFASFWRDSLEAYAGAGVFPDYVSIQNNPNWVPGADNLNEGCRFLPEEGSVTVEIGGAPVEVAYPGYREALDAVQAAIVDLPGPPPRFGAVEANGLAHVGDYVAALDAGNFDALAVHVYDMDPSEVDVAQLAAVRELGEQLGRPVLQTEMQAEGLETAVLVHHALTSGGAVAYLQNDLVALREAQASIALVLLNEDGFTAQPPYYALSQYAKHTDPGWIRIGASSDSSRLLASGWLEPDEGALTLVLVNPEADALVTELVLPEGVRERLLRTEVAGTVFGGTDRSAAPGELSSSGVVRVPGRAVVTIALATP